MRHKAGGRRQEASSCCCPSSDGTVEGQRVERASLCAKGYYAAVSLQTGHWSAHWSVTHVIFAYPLGRARDTQRDQRSAPYFWAFLLTVRERVRIRVLSTRPANSRKLKTFSRWILMIFIFKLALRALPKVRSSFHSSPLLAYSFPFGQLAARGVSESQLSS